MSPTSFSAHTTRFGAAGHAQQITVKIICLLLLSGFWFFTTYINTPHIFSGYDLAFIFILIMVVVGLQGLVLAACAALPTTVVNALAGAFALSNGYSTCLIFAPIISSLAPWWFILLALGAWWVASVCFASLSVGGWWLRAALGVLSLLFIMAAAGALTTLVKANAATPTVASTATATMTSSPRVKIVDFTHKPNVYLLSFDAMVPAALAKQILALPSLPYQDYIQQQGLLRLTNHFSDGPDTISSLNQFFALDAEYFHTLAQQNKYRGIVSGHAPSPLLEIFNANGYRTNIYHQGNYLGNRKGPYIDHYHVNFYHVSACGYLTSERHLRYGLLGYCQWQKLWRHFVLAAPPIGVLSDVRIMFADVAARLPDGPAVFYAHFLSPLHVAWDFTGQPTQLTDYREIYHRNSADTAMAIKTIMAFIKKHDPTALVFIFSDHGLHTNRYWQWQNLATESQKREYIISYYGAFGALYPPALCADYIKPRLYSVNSQIARDLIRCLANGEDPFVQPPHYSLSQWRIGWGDEQNGDYANFLYE